MTNRTLWTYRGLVLALMLAATPAARSAPVIWTDWRSGTEGTNGTASGVLMIDGEAIDVTYTGEIQFLQTGTGTNYFEPSAPYLSATVDNAPPAAEMIALSQASVKTLTFSKAVSNLLFAVVSLNGNGYRFDSDFEILSYGRGYWGDGTLDKTNPSPGVYQLNGTGEPHGVIEFQGAVTTITWTSLTNENWNGFTVGVRGLAPSAVPEPSSLALACLGAAGLGGVVVRRRREDRSARS
ncbi:PEP-CTERM sorting domain-containing protein [Paludisphaera mucosa]|uniref:PEP-CTERM sorting domain-containing protein n=1 Tax=Paludisphaera mucosa TaxID=3030827 RepID=A0ABT6FBM3_9BACT|nr:PEP-CTERM sorting domain-containing protein [Paludisphaera mucosa]MDG3004937.1 PEP-CTERM sorting domain-containing protein [Paludisphaera mucosa]